MFVSLIIISLISFSGLSLTYLFSKEENLLWRLSAGNIVGSAVFGFVSFIVASFFGLSMATVLISLAISMTPLLWLRNKETNKLLKFEWQRGKDRNQGASSKKFWRLAYYLFFIILFVAFFDRAMIVTSNGIFTGASQNLGDLPFHLGAIFGFTEGQNFPPQNPSYAGAKFTYPFIADLLTACLVKLGVSVKNAMFVQNVSWAFSLLVIFEQFVSRVSRSRLAGKIAPFILFFSGGLGFLWFFGDYFQGTKGFIELIWNLPQDYTIGEKFRWGNSLVVLFITQRSLLLGMPLTIIVLGYWWKIFTFENKNAAGVHESKGNTKKKRKEKAEKITFLPVSISPLAVGLLAGTLPLIHAHSLVVLFVVSVSWFFASYRHWKQWIVFAVGVCVMAIPQFVWILSGSATRLSEFIGWHFGWDLDDGGLLYFWLKNTGIFIPILFAGMAYVIYLAMRGLNAYKEDSKKRPEKNQEPKGFIPSYSLLFAYTPFFVLIFAANILKLAPWEWDNIKILIYGFVGSIPFVTIILAWMWQRDRIYRALSITCLVVLTFSGGLDIWRTVSAQINNEVFDKDAIEIAELIKTNTKPDALFLNAPTYNSAVVLSGRRSLMRYIGHLSSHGIAYQEREKDLKRIYSGASTTDILLKKYEIDYVLISPKETESLQVNEEFFRRYRLLIEAGRYKVYKVSERK